MKPVAYILRNEYNEYRLEPMDDFDIKTMPVEVEVSLVPKRKWVGLTDEDLQEIIGTGDSIGHYIKTTEAKLRSKNGY